MTPLAAAPASAALCKLPFSIFFAATLRRCFLAASTLIAAAATYVYRPARYRAAPVRLSVLLTTTLESLLTPLLLKSYNLIRAYSHITVTRTTRTLVLRSSTRAAKRVLIGAVWQIKEAIGMTVSHHATLTCSRLSRTCCITSARRISRLVTFLPHSAPAALNGFHFHYQLE